MKKIALIGANGQLGSDFFIDLSSKYSLFPLNEPEFHIENKEQVFKTLGSIKPDIVINTAAFHNLSNCEEDPQKTFLINASSVKDLGEICKKLDATLVHFSTDYVYGKEISRKKPYVEDDCPGPIQVYGASKLAGEILLNTYCEKYFCLRISGLYGLKGTSAKKYPNFVEMMIELGKNAKIEGKKLPSVCDQVLTFNPTKEIVKVVEKLLKKDKYGIYHATCEGYCSRAEFTRKIFEFIDLDVDIKDVPSEYFKTNYNQPSFSALENSKLKNMGIYMPKWEDGLKNYLKNRKIAH